jgi:disease resistance protein RPS2
VRVLPFPFLIFFLKKKINMGGPARADAQASRAVNSPLGMEVTKVSLQGRAMQLFERLSKGKKILIVLEDVWDVLDFESIEIPYLEHEKSYKILFTSRDEKVCQNMGCKVNFAVSVLKKDEAWYLFREMAGEIIDRPDINPIARDVANECGGLPLAIVTVGRSC